MGGMSDRELAQAYQKLFPEVDIVTIRGEPIAIKDTELERLG
jgi:hypothetical protein